ncbi:Signal transduction histidine kinase [Sphingomonas gellani]|uniref:histidine kinase n=1 Tax=Sphingomonas gellani TaxID=1166340 RepID=A0A1H8F1R6_9SPHN|nr:HAMP domain-containing sensor histidine kinase [Sphingomonas gellani]SEN25682.1 Signal transduction histidine kinase [Sphingomonas gellani]
MRLSVSARITLLSIALALISNLVLVGFVWKQTHDQTIAEVRRETVERTDALLAVWRTGGQPALVEALRGPRVPGDMTLIGALIDGQGRKVVGRGPDHLAARLETLPFAVGHVSDAPGWSERDAGFALHPIGSHWLLTGRMLDVIAAEERAIEGALGLAVLLSLVLGIGAGLVVAQYVSRRMDAIAGVVEAAGEGDLSRRVPAASGGDAFDRLGVRLNAMLAKVERLMSELRLVTDSLAHDLRSPLARLRTRAEQAVLMSEAGGREAALNGLLTETDLVMRMLTTVIEISRSEAVSRDRFTQSDPAELIGAIAELYEPVVEEAGLAFDAGIAAGLPTMPLHRELLSQAVANLLDNAVKHGGSGGTVTLTLGHAEGGVAIRVADHGPGIAVADRAQALKRFGRLDSARTTPGAGLGMALVEAVARLHGGRFELADNEPGLAATLILPATSI